MSEAQTQLNISVEWEDPLGARGDVLRATWARLGIQVGSTCITEFFDERASTVRGTVYGPAYPLAEWIAVQWWALTQETERFVGTDLFQRHNFRAAREGFALPNVSFFRQGDWVKAIWSGSSPVAVEGRFIALPSFAQITANDYILGLRQFVEAVIARLDAKNISETQLQTTWAWVLASEADVAERKFCISAGSLGLDPYSLEDKVAEDIVTVGGNLPDSLHDEFYKGAPPDSILTEAKDVSRIIKEVVKAKSNRHIGTYSGWNKGVARSNRLAWESGYDLAQAFRRDGGKWQSVKKKIAVLEVPKIGSGGAFSGIAEVGKRLVVATDRKRESSQNFIKAQVFCEQLSVHADQSYALISRAQTDRQARNRAFAAELLAPAADIKLELSSGIDSDEIDRLADKFDVSEWVIAHQIENHKLAECL